MPCPPPRLRPFVLGLLALALTAPGPVFAAPGDTDPTFDGDGVVEDHTRSGANTVLAQPDGKILAVLDGEFGVVRYENDGTLDTAFGMGGLAAADFGTEGGAIATTGLLAPDGKIVVVGIASPYSASAQFAIARFDTNGQLDPSFGIGGKRLTVFIGDTGDIATVVRLPSARIIVGGRGSGGTPHGILLAFDDAGAEDLGFGIDGIAVTLNPRAIDALAVNAHENPAVYGDEMIAVGSSSDDRVVLLRFDADATMGSVTTFLEPISFPNGLAIDSAGRIVVVGGTDYCQRTFVARFRADGTFDPTFGLGGTAIVDVRPTSNSACSDFGRAVALQPDGRILVAVEGQNYDAPPSFLTLRSWRLLRLEFDGTVDTTFGDDGVVARTESAPQALALQSDGKIVTGGFGAVPMYDQWPLVYLDYSLLLTRHEAMATPVCTAAPRGDCNAAGARGASLKLSRSSGKLPSLQWAWKKGSAMPTDIGNPMAGGSYALCLYDGTNALVATAQVDGGGTCGGKPCWKAAGPHGWQYQDKAARTFGIDKVKLKSGTGSAAFSYKGRRGNVPVVPLPVALPLRAQLQASTGACFDATYATALRNDATDFKAKN